jgi:excinuclease ABC subunit C
LFLVQRVRDEAHRFAITAHRTQRAKVGLASQLDMIPGVGPARRRQLLKRFGSLDGIREASEDDLAQIVPRTVAQAVKASL